VTPTVLLSGSVHPESVIELRCEHHVVVARRLPDGRLLVGTAELPAASRIGRWPLVRGLRNFGENAFPRFSAWLEEVPAVQKLTPVPRDVSSRLTRYLVLNAVMALLPQLGAAGLVRVFGLAVPLHAPAFHALTALTAVVAIVVYAKLIVGFADIFAVFQCNAVILRVTAAEALGSPVSTETLRAQRSFHPFANSIGILLSILVTMGLSIAAGSAAPTAFGDSAVGHVSLVAFKVAVLPLVIAVTYEVQVALSRLYEIDALRGALRALLAFQRLWVREPTDDQLALGATAYRALPPTATR
jgi:uncharacterized protein YqhQ